MMGDETGRRKKEEDDERLAEKMEKILKEKQETAETIEKEPEEVKLELEKDCRVGKRPMDQQGEGPERKRVQVRVKDALAQWGQRRSAGREKRGPQETPRRCRERTRDRERMHPRESRRSCPWTFL